MKRTISCILTLSILFLAFGTVANANEVTDTSIQKEYICDTLPQEYSSSITFGEIQDEINKYLEIFHPHIEVDSDEYIQFLYNVLFGTENIKNDITYTYFAAYASTYVCNLQEQQAEEKFTQNEEEANPMGQELERTIEQEKQSNIEAENEVKVLAEENSISLAAASGYDVARAQQYAKTYAKSWNPVFGRYAEDCTNFASQIVNYAGFPLVPGTWQWNGNEAAKKTWNVANDFTNYWSLI